MRISGRVATGPGRAALAALPGLGAPTEAILFSPLRLGRSVVQLAAISPLARWVTPAESGAPCRPTGCRLLLASGPARPGAVAIPGADLRLAGRTTLTSAVPLGFRPFAAAAYAAGGPPPVALLLGGDPAGLARLPGLASVFRTTTLVAVLAVNRVHSWDLPRLEDGLQRDQADLTATDSGLSLSAPFALLDAARAHAAQAPRGLLAVAGAAAAVIAAFVLLAAGTLRPEVAGELARLRAAGATRTQSGLLVVVEAAALSGLGVLAGAGAGVALVAALARRSAEPPGAILAHSLGTVGAAGVLLGAWTAITLLIAGVLLLRARPGIADLVGVVGVGALGVAGVSGGLPALLVAPVGCLLAGALVFRVAAGILRRGERAARRGPVAVRLALVNLARAPAGPAGTAAFLTVSVGLGVFALAYGATLSRGAADQAASKVPLDVTVAAGPSFAPPVALAPLARWREIAGGPVLPVRRTQASFPSGGETATVPLVALPASGLALLRGWAADDASAARGTLAARLTPVGPMRTPGPTLPAGARRLSVTASAVNIGVSLTAVLRRPDGTVETLPLGVLTARARVLGAALPPAPGFELAALELDEPAGLAATSGHQNAESPTPETLLRGRVTIDRALAFGPGPSSPTRLGLAGWRARGAAASARGRGGGLSVEFTAGDGTGVLGPPQPGDRTPLPVLVDPGSAAQAGRGGRLGLSDDGVTVDARVVGRLRRFPTLAAGGLVVADEPALAARLDAAAPGQGRPDELWLLAPDLARTRRALADPRLASLAVAFRADIDHALRTDAVFRGVARALGLAAAAAGALAVAGLLLLGRSRDRVLEEDLAAQGMGPRALRADARLRLLATAGLGISGGLAAGLALSRLAAAAVSGTAPLVADGRPLAAVVPWGELGLFVAATVAALGGAAWAATGGTR